MPQFDPTHYSSQIFWTLLCFLCLWSAMQWFVVPTIIKIDKRRQRSVCHLLEEAKKLENQAHDIMKECQSYAESVKSSLKEDLKKAKEDAQESYLDYTQKVQEIFDHKIKNFREDLEIVKSEFLDTLHEESQDAALFLVNHYHTAGHHKKGPHHA